MGNHSNVSIHPLNPWKKLNRNSFDFEKIIGRGGFGKVWKVVFKKTSKVYAMKEMSKTRIIDKKMEKNIMMERELLSWLKNPFLVNMVYAFQDYENWYLTMDLIQGGDLRYIFSQYGKFNEEQTKFVLACLITALKYVHSKNIIHRDIKPENLIFNEKGYLHWTDFGIGLIIKGDNSRETSGTPGYMSPEVINGLKHSFPTDYYAVGVIGYELLVGRRPWWSNSRSHLKEQIMSKQIRLNSSDHPDISRSAIDFINQLLQRKASRRLGGRGIQEIQQHCWFENYDWNALLKGRLQSPFEGIIDINNHFDSKYCRATENVGYDTMERYNKYMAIEGFINFFLGYTFNNDDEQRDLSRHAFSSGNTSRVNPDQNKSIIDDTLLWNQRIAKLGKQNLDSYRRKDHEDNKDVVFFTEEDGKTPDQQGKSSVLLNNKNKVILPKIKRIKHGDIPLFKGKLQNSQSCSTWISDAVNSSNTNPLLNSSNINVYNSASLNNTILPYSNKSSNCLKMDKATYENLNRINRITKGQSECDDIQRSVKARSSEKLKVKKSGSVIQWLDKSNWMKKDNPNTIKMKMIKVKGKEINWKGRTQLKQGDKSGFNLFSGVNTNKHVNNRYGSQESKN